MTSTQNLPVVQGCTVSACSYNQDSDCHAGAITIAGDHAHCGTFVEISFRGGLERGGVVGACHRAECVHNEKLVCTASSVQIGESTGQENGDRADCLTYEAR